MARDHKGQGDILVKPSEHVPQQVSYHSVVLVLTPTVVSVEVDILLAKPMYFEEVMEHADDGIGSLAGVNGLVNQVIDLTWDSLTAHSIDGTLSWGKEVHGARLEGVIWVEYLLAMLKE
ncbi:MAG: hypothetical protein MJE68_05350 [Proteobacteria bacterium]|nr:hypothetical protein [Pseudomonadota bacterium]